MMNANNVILRRLLKRVYGCRRAASTTAEIEPVVPYKPFIEHEDTDDTEFKPLPGSIESFQDHSRRFVFEQPGTNTRNLASYLRGDYPGWSTYFVPKLRINQWQRQAMFQRECERALFQRNPREFSPQDLGFVEMVREPAVILKIIDQDPTEFVLYHELCEMWKRRQVMDVPYINVGSYVEVKMRSRHDFARSVTYTGLVTEKEHKNLNAYFIVRQNISNGNSLENLIHYYSPWLESVKVLSYQVRDSKTGNLHCLRDLSYEQSSLPDPIPEPMFDEEHEVEVPHFIPLQLDFRKDTRQQRRNQHSKHLLPHRNDTLRLYKLWETDPRHRYPRPNIKKKSITK